MNFEKMSFEQLIKESEKEAADAWTAAEWQSWQYEIKKKAPEYFREMSIVDLEIFYKEHPQEDTPYWMDAWLDAYLNCWPISDIYERIRSLERSVDVLLKKYGSVDAGISINQLIKLKGGYQ